MKQQIIIETKLTKPQLDKLLFDLVLCKKHWTQKKKHALTLIRSFKIDIEEDDLKWFIEEFLPSEEKRLKQNYFIDCQKGIRNTNITPTDVANTLGANFTKVLTPRIGFKYHLAWAFKGAIFRLVKIDDDNVHGYVDNPKYKRKELLKIKLEDLRNLNKKK